MEQLTLSPRSLSNFRIFVGQTAQSQHFLTYCTNNNPYDQFFHHLYLYIIDRLMLKSNKLLKQLKLSPGTLSNPEIIVGQTAQNPQFLTYRTNNNPYDHFSSSPILKQWWSTNSIVKRTVETAHIVSTYPVKPLNHCRTDCSKPTVLNISHQQQPLWPLVFITNIKTTMIDKFHNQSNCWNSSHCLRVPCKTPESLSDRQLKTHSSWHIAPTATLVTTFLHHQN